MARPTATSTTSRASSSTSSSLTTTVTVENDPAAYSSSSSSSSRPQETLVLELRPRKKKVTWKEGTVDNEFMNKRSSKICCVFHKEKPFDEEDSDDDCHDHHHGHPSNGNGPSNDSCRPNTSKINMSPNIGDDLRAMFLDSDLMSDTSMCPTWTVMVQFLAWLHSLPAILYQVASWYLLAMQTYYVTRTSL